MTTRKKDETITFKVDDRLACAMRGVANRSEFIRKAILLALDNACPLCGGSGILSEEQRKHWRSFSRYHAVIECGKCRAIHIVCSKGGRGAAAHGKGKKRCD